MAHAIRPVMFAAEFQAASPQSRRRAPRAAVALDAGTGRGGFDRALCRVTSLSPLGARLTTYSALKPGAVIWLTLPHVGPRIARVAWADDFEAGCQFEDALSAEQYDRLPATDQAQPAHA